MRQFLAFHASGDYVIYDWNYILGIVFTNGNEVIIRFTTGDYRTYLCTGEQFKVVKDMVQNYIIKGKTD